MRRIVLGLLAVGFAVAGAGCGGGGGKGEASAPVSNDEFTNEANAICQAGDARLGQEGGEIMANTKSTPEEVVKFFLEHAIPIARDKLKQISELTPPAQEKGKVRKMLADGGKAIDTVEAGLKGKGAAYLQSPGSADPFADFNAEAKALNLTDCIGKR
jgi:hypothetical protein